MKAMMCVVASPAKFARDILFAQSTFCELSFGGRNLCCNLEHVLRCVGGNVPSTQLFDFVILHGVVVMYRLKCGYIVSFSYVGWGAFVSANALLSLLMVGNY